MPAHQPHHIGHGRARSPARDKAALVLPMVLLALAGSSLPIAAQHLPNDTVRMAPPQPSQLVLREHAVAIPLGIAAAGFSGFVIYDIVTAPRSAREHNELNPDAPPRSGATAFLLSFGATALPVLVGAASEDLIPVAAAGVVLGPSAGHWYAGMDRRAWINAGIRAVIVLAGGIAWSFT